MILLTSFAGAAVGGVVSAILGLQLQKNNHSFEEIQGEKNEAFLNKQNERDNNFKKELQKQNDALTLSIQQKTRALTREMKQVDIDANLKAKARIEWITNVRDLSSNYIACLFCFNDSMEKIYNLDNAIHIYETSPLWQTSDKLPEAVSNRKLELEEMHSLKNEIISLSERILMQFSVQKEHEEIENTITSSVDLVIDVYRTARDKLGYKYVEKTEKDMTGFAKSIRKIFRDYLKKEWDKAKEGK
nr:hypothetical protein [Enterococcus sp. 669A]